MTTSALHALGWQPFFQSQLDLDEWDTCNPSRIIEQHRSEIMLSDGEQTYRHAILASMPEMVVGDWVLLNHEQRFVRLLERKTCFSRKAAGAKHSKQLIAANVDTAFILSSMNDDFNLNRFERYLSLVNEAGAEPVILLSKADQTENRDNYVDQIRSLDKFLMVESINNLDGSAIDIVAPWIKTGATVVLIGSSGVGKSTLTNTLTGNATQETSGIREDDSKGRHTTTSRSLVQLLNGGMILDTPGMREVQLADSKEGISSTFADIEQLTELCKFGDCSHANEPGCAIRKALESGELEQRRFDNYKKLLREDALNSASLAEKRASDKAFGKFIKRTQAQSMQFKGRD